MHMTRFEQDIYNGFTRAMKADFDEYVEEHPGCTFQEACNYVGNANSIKDQIRIGTITPDTKITEDPQILKKILQGATEWYQTYAKPLWEDVKYVFRETMNYLDDLIDRGIQWINKQVGRAIDWLIELFT